jgi:hypothetical protein
MAVRRETYKEDVWYLLAAAVMVLLIVTSTDIFGQYPLKQGDTKGALVGTPPPGFVFKEEDILDETGYTGEGQSSELALDLGPDVVGLIVELTWVDDIGSNDQFSLTLKCEGSDMGSVSGTQGTLELSTNHTAKGNYTIIVRAVNCPGMFPRLPFDRDQGNDWAINVKSIRKVPITEGE